MNILKYVCLTISQLAKLVGSLPQSLAVIVRQRRLKIARNAFEIERLDRIRNPSKYLGK